MEVVFLGTGNAFASAGRHHMAVLLQGESLGVLLDCGPSVLVALRQQALDPDSVDVVLISHLHGDHFAGVPMLAVDALYGAGNGAARRTKPFHVFGPRDTSRVMKAACELFYPGMERPPLELRDLRAGEAHRFANLIATPFEVDHFSSGPAFGYRIELDGKSIVFSGDTAWTDVLLDAAGGADLFICECSSFDAPEGKHIAHQDLTRNRDRIGAKRTVLVHAGEDVVARERELAFELAHDGTRIEL